MEKILKKKISDLTRENNELKAHVEQLEHDLIHDELTGLKSRRFLVSSVKTHLKLIFSTVDGLRDPNKKCEKDIGFLFCDVDYFKKVNDTLGHEAGDEVLKKIARALEESVREMDIVARFGGEEILIALFDTDSKDSEIVAEKIRKAVEDLKFKDYPKLHVTISIGVSSTSLPHGVEESGESKIDKIFDEYIRRADSAVYNAKNRGRNRVVVWSPELKRNQHGTSFREKIKNIIIDKRKNN